MKIITKNKINQPLVTVGIPAYNRPFGLEKVLECVMSQTYKNIEIIVSDDYSPTTEVGNVVKKLQLRDSRIIFYRQEVNLDAVKNHRFLLKVAKGKYIIWLSDDDLCEPGFVAALVDRMESDDNAILCGCNVKVIDENDRLIRIEELSDALDGEDWSKIRQKFFSFPGSNLYLVYFGLFRVDTMRENSVGQYEGCHGYNSFMEVPFLAKVSSVGQIIATDEVLISYRNHTDSRYYKEMTKMTILDRFFVGLCVRKKLVSIAVNADISIWDRLVLLKVILMSFVIDSLLKTLPILVIRRIRRKVVSIAPKIVRK